MRTQVLVVAMAILAACSQPAASSTSADQQEAELQKEAEQYNAGQKSARDKVECRMEAVTGSRIKQKVCRTVAVMEQDEQNAQRLIKEIKPTPPSGD